MKLTDLSVGMTVTTDEGFTCMPAGKATVQQDKTGFYIPCDGGKHYLDGQAGPDGELIGIALAT